MSANGNTTEDHDNPMYRIVSIDADHDDLKFQPSASIDLSPTNAAGLKIAKNFCFCFF